MMPETFQVMVPQAPPVEPDAQTEEGAVVMDELAVAQEQGRILQARVEELEERWGSQEEIFDERVRQVEAKAAERAAEAVHRLTSTLDDFMAQREELLKSSEGTVIKLATALARKIIGDAVTINEDIVLETVRRALKHVVEKETVILRVNPEDLKIVREHRSEWISIVEGTRALEIEEDERIRRGGCLVETETGSVEAQIEKQIRTLERVLTEKVS
jgi:flagellar biosynthesis/type III secretory pathway protein FliH